MKNSENLSMYPFQNSMDMKVILKPEKNTKYFIRLTPKHFWNLYKFLGNAKFSLGYLKNTKKQDFTGRKFYTLGCWATLYHFIAVTTWLQHFYIGSFLPSPRIYNSYNFYNMDIVFVQTFPDYKVHDFPWTTKYTGRLCQRFFRPFKNICASIDCTEFKCELPRNYSQQGNLYSPYKSHCTMKCLIAV